MFVPTPARLRRIDLSSECATPVVVISDPDWSAIADTSSVRMAVECAARQHQHQLGNWSLSDDGSICAECALCGCEAIVQYRGSDLPSIVKGLPDSCPVGAEGDDSN
jgi:hypothetical protein